MKRLSPSELKKQELNELLQGRSEFKNGESMLSELIRLTTEKNLQELLEHEQSEVLGRDRYERKTGIGHRNGYEPGTLKTAEGVFKVQLPQVRGLENTYCSRLWQDMGKTSQHLKDLINEMYVHGMSQRDIEESLTITLGQFVLSKSSISLLTEELLKDYELFKARALDVFDIAYIFLDTVYEPLRQYGSRTGILCCWGICADGSKVLIDLTLSKSESAESTKDFLYGLIKRGLRTPLTITTDGAPGLIKAIEEVWPRSKRIRCWFHKMQNLMQKVPDEIWPEFKAMLQDMRDAPTKQQAEKRYLEILDSYQRELPEACRCLSDDVEASLNHLHVPLRHRAYVRTTNLIERTFVEQRRRTKIIPHMWDEKQLTKLIFAVLIRVSDRWNRRQFSDLEKCQIYALRKEFFGENDKPTDSPKKKRRAASQPNEQFYREIGT
jgi:putative transposase